MNICTRWRGGETVNSEDQQAIGEEARMDESILSTAPSLSNLHSAVMADKPTAQLQVKYIPIHQACSQKLVYGLYKNVA